MNILTVDRQAFKDAAKPASDKYLTSVWGADILKQVNSMK